MFGFMEECGPVENDDSYRVQRAAEIMLQAQQIEDDKDLSEKVAAFLKTHQKTVSEALKEVDDTKEADKAIKFLEKLQGG